MQTLKKLVKKFILIEIKFDLKFGSIRNSFLVRKFHCNSYHQPTIESTNNVVKTNWKLSKISPIGQ
jgi:hypothetical protein